MGSFTKKSSNFRNPNFTIKGHNLSYSDKKLFFATKLLFYGKKNKQTKPQHLKTQLKDQNIQVPRLQLSFWKKHF